MWYIDSSVYKDILETIGNAPIESGGIIGIKNNVICAYYFDKSTYNKESKYVPNISRLNLIIKKWHKQGIEFAGIVHSHPNSYNKPSLSDGDYAKILMENNTFLNRLFFPIVTKNKYGVQLTFYEYTNAFYLTNVICVCPKNMD